MKCKKNNYILLLILMLVVGVNKTYACFYSTSDNKTLIEYNTQTGKAEILKRNGLMIDDNNKDPLINNGKSFSDKETGITISAVSSGSCPSYIVYRRKIRGWLIPSSDGIFGFSNNTSAEKFSNMSNNIEDMSSYVLSQKKLDGSIITETEFKNYLNDYKDVSTDCDSLFGSKSDPNSINYLVNEILEYPRIIVPILIILLGTMDFAKAVIAGKEDNMKKAQATFVKRIIAGVAVFFVPIIINILMYFADIVWAGTGYTSCGIK